MDSSFWWKDKLKPYHKRYHQNQGGVLQKLFKSIVIKVVLGNRFCNLRRSPIVIFALVVTIFRWFSNANLESSMMPTCF